jgi:hypothetical protein
MLHQEQREQEKQQSNVKEECLNLDSDPYGIFVFAIIRQ